MKIQITITCLILLGYLQSGISQTDFTLHTGITYGAITAQALGNGPEGNSSYNANFYGGLGLNHHIGSSVYLNNRLQYAVREGTYTHHFGEPFSWRYEMIEYSLAVEKRFYEKVGIYFGGSIGRITKSSYKDFGQDYSRFGPGDFHNKMQYSVLLGGKLHFGRISILADYQHFLVPQIEIPFEGTEMIPAGTYTENLKSFNLGIEVSF